ncbi:MAG: MBL fold metallo-hydrolase [Gemmatimonadetes bacterium]|nr:MBL fold metallo-hydrolase [Gemmatimonadota bacterium]
MNEVPPLPVAWFVTPNPGPLTLDGTCCYAVGQRRLILIDPGPALPGQIERLEELVAGRPVEAICLTHAHADHSAIAELASRHFGAPVAASAETLSRRGLSGRALAGGELLKVDGGERELGAIQTPGHSADHLAYLLLPGRAVFTGDLVLGSGSSAVLHPDGEVAACLGSLSRVLSLRPGRLYPGHGSPVDEGEALLRHYRHHRLERHGQVMDAVRAGARGVDELRGVVYGPLTDELARAADASIRAHVVYMREQGHHVPAMAGLDDLSPLPEES